jgi:hypothetical protein
VNGSTFTCSVKYIYPFELTIGISLKTAIPPECSSSHPVFSGACVGFFLCVSFCGILFVLSSFFLLTLAFSVLLRFTAFDYPFGIFKLFQVNSNG